MMYGRNLARHVHFKVLHVHHNIYGVMVFSFGVLCFVPALVNVQCLVCMHDLTLKGQCKPHGLGIILGESCSKLLLHSTKWGSENAKLSTLERSILL